MTEEPTYWSKEELKVYVLLLCAKSDSISTEEEIDLIRSKTDPVTFDKMNSIIAGDKENKSLKKIRKNLVFHHYTNRELSQLRREMDEVFLADNVFNMKERTMDEILDNILY